MYVCMYACMHVCMYACMHACMHACVHVCMYVCKCRYSLVVRSWAGVRRSQVQFQPLSTIRVRRQTLQSLWGSAFASRANTGQPGQALEGKTRRVKTSIVMILMVEAPCYSNHGNYNSNNNNSNDKS